MTYAAVDGGAAEKYEGDWSDGKMHGYGKYFYADGGVYASPDQRLERPRLAADHRVAHRGRHCSAADDV